MVTKNDVKSVLVTPWLQLVFAGFYLILTGWALVVGETLIAAVGVLLIILSVMNYLTRRRLENNITTTTVQPEDTYVVGDVTVSRVPVPEDPKVAGSSGVIADPVTDTFTPREGASEVKTN